MQLYDYFRSSAAYRVRITLNLKGLAYDALSVNLLRGEESDAGYRAINPQGLVPALCHDGATLTQSLAICEYLEEIQPAPSILPGNAQERARIRALAQAIACDIHPVNNLRILNYLTGELGISEEQKLSWYRHWISEGFSAIESMLASSEQTGRFCHGETPTLADICLVPQLFNAHRFDVDLAPFPTISRIDAACSQLQAFEKARPECQPDAGQ
jgi:maleylacetoacetate isomerase